MLRCFLGTYSLSVGRDKHLNTLSCSTSICTTRAQCINSIQKVSCPAACSWVQKESWALAQLAHHHEGTLGWWNLLELAWSCPVSRKRKGFHSPFASTPASSADRSAEDPPCCSTHLQGQDWLHQHPGRCLAWGDAVSPQGNISSCFSLGPSRKVGGCKEVHGAPEVGTELQMWGWPHGPRDVGQWWSHQVDG